LQPPQSLSIRERKASDSQSPNQVTCENPDSAKKSARGDADEA
jgi:hypothetical protein